MKTLTVNRRVFLFAIISWFAIFFILEITNYDRFELLNIIGFISLAILPGILTILISKIRTLPFWGYVALAIGFSLLEMMLTALLGNTLLPFAGITRPLDKPVLLFELYLLVGALAVIAVIRMDDIHIPIKKYLFFDEFKNIALSFTPILFVILSIFGAIRLNNGGSNIFTMIMLGAMAAYAVVLIRYSKNCDGQTLPTAIFFMALSLLFMTSLRGWFVTGHDIQQETQFFELTKTKGFWDIVISKNAYNACLSITILPTIFANLLNVADQYIFKFFFQIFFALCPVLVYLIGQQWAGRRIALFSAIYFMTFPTFFTDMPFLVRQEIAFVFFGLMLYLVFEPTLSLYARRILFMLMGIGVILSHYSTTYTVLVIFGLSLIFAPIINKILKSVKISFSQEALTESKITAVMVVVLLMLSFLWTSTITHTGGELSSVVTQTFQAIKEGFAGDNRSIDAMNLLSFTNINPTQELQSYLQTTVEQIRATASLTNYFSPSIYDQYPIVLSTSPTLPISSFGKFLDASGIDITGASLFLSTLVGKLMEILVPIGIIMIFFRRILKKSIDPQMYWIALFCALFVAANVILPVLSAEYGVYRAMQQSLFVLGFFIVIGSDTLGETFSSILIIIFFLYSTSFIPQLMGSNSPQLYLNDSGIYYDNYLMHGSEVSAESWLLAHVPNSTTIEPQPPAGVNLLNQTEFQSNKMFQSLEGSNPANDLLPALIRRDSYVFLGEGTVKDDQASFDFNGSIVSYVYPIQFLDNNKDLIYNDGGSRIYR